MENSLTSISADKERECKCHHETDEKNNATPRKCKKCRQYIMEDGEIKSTTQAPPQT
jgi:hypothetical protein